MKIVIVFILTFSLIYANTCGGNCPSNTCTSCICGTSPSWQDIATWCAKYSGWSQSCCQCIAKHESGGNANAQNKNSNGSNDIGLWQINDMNWSSCSGGAAPCDASKNLECAKKVFAWGGNTWKLWSTCGACGCCGSKLEDEEIINENLHDTEVPSTEISTD